YTEPASVAACDAANGGVSEACPQPGADFHPTAALDPKTGEPPWAYRAVGGVPPHRAGRGPPPPGAGGAGRARHHEGGFGGSAPNLFRLRMDGHWRDVLGVGEKSGVYLFLDARTGAFIWNTLVGPGADQGGFEWGTAYDGTRIYGAITNQHNIPYRLTPS